MTPFSYFNVLLFILIWPKTQSFFQNTQIMQGGRNTFHIGGRHGRPYYQLLLATISYYQKLLLAPILLFLFCVSVPCFFILCVLYRFHRKSRDRFSPFQQEVYFLPELEEFLFSLNYLKSSFFKVSPIQSLQNHFSIYVYILKISSQILHTI